MIKPNIEKRGLQMSNKHIVIYKSYDKNYNNYYMFIYKN